MGGYSRCSNSQRTISLAGRCAGLKEYQIQVEQRFEAHFLVVPTWAILDVSLDVMEGRIEDLERRQQVVKFSVRVARLTFRRLERHGALLVADSF